MLKLSNEHKVFILFFLLFAIFTKHNVSGVNDAGVYATTESLVERGTFAIDDSTFNWTIDKIYMNGHFYGLKPFLSIMGAVPYLLLHNIFGISFTNAPAISYYIIILFTVGLTSASLMMFFYKSLDFVSINEKSKYLLTFALGAGTLIFPYTTTLNDHTVSASFLFIGFYFLIKARFHDENMSRSILFSAVFVGLSSMISTSEILFIPLFFIYVIYHEKLKKFWRTYVYAVVVILLTSSIVCILSTGSFLPPHVLIFFKTDVLHYEGSYWNNPLGIDTLNDPIHIYLFNILIGHHGIFTFTPILIFSFIMILKIATNKKHLFFKESVLVSIAIVTSILIRMSYLSNYGGLSFGFRFFILLTPLLLFFTAFLFKEIKSEFNRRIFYVLLFASVFMSFIGTGAYPINCASCPWVMFPYYVTLILLFLSVITGIFLMISLSYLNDIKEFYSSLAKLNKFHILLSLVLMLAFFTRVYALFKTGGIIHPDELYQYIEQPHRLMFGYGVITWEFIEGARSWVYPFAIYLVFKISAFIGFANINEMVFSARLFNTIFSILLIPLIYLLGKELYNKNVGLISAFFATFSYLMLWTARIMPEIISTFFSTLTVLFLYRGIKNNDKIGIFMSGIFLGLSFVLVFRSAVLLIPLLIYAIYRRYGFRYILAGFSLILIAQGILDLYTWGSFLHSPVEYLKYNIIEGKSSEIGTEPIWFYIYSLMLFLPLLLFIPYAVEPKESSKYLFLNFGFYLLILSLIPHKEERFILSVLPLFFILAATGFEKFTMKFSGINGRIIAIGSVIAYLIISPLNPAIYDDALWAPYSDNLKAMEYVGLQNDSTGVAYTVPWYNTGGYTYLHKNIPAVYLTSNVSLCNEINNPAPGFFPCLGNLCKEINNSMKSETLSFFELKCMEDLVSEPYMNYVVASKSESPNIIPLLHENNFTEVKSFGNVSVFKKNS